MKKLIKIEYVPEGAFFIFCTCAAHVSSNKQYSIITSLFFRRALGHKFFHTEYSRVTCICEGGDAKDVPSTPTTIVVIGEKRGAARRYANAGRSTPFVIADTPAVTGGHRAIILKGTKTFGGNFSSVGVE